MVQRSGILVGALDPRLLHFEHEKATPVHAARIDDQALEVDALVTTCVNSGSCKPPS